VEKVSDHVEHRAATHYLQDLSLSIGEVAYLLGYSEPSAFHRAFKRWNKITPRNFGFNELKNALTGTSR
jgi:AraC-like DNA-binding protein